MPVLGIEPTKGENMKCDIEPEGNYSHESEQGSCGCVHHVNEDDLKTK
ncbi:hypothetical protein MTYM_00842 [Methylococcales bacterium]|nr:hypothetical protein MTYM_00842 [Methylococcales bacterium]